MPQRWLPHAPACAGAPLPLVLLWRLPLPLLCPEWLAMLAALPGHGGAHG